MINRAISAARAIWYGATEPARLRLARAANEHRFWTSGAVAPFFPDGYPTQWENPLVSVIVPTHNRVDLLMDRFLPSVLAYGQTYNWIEVIIAAHGCTDDTVPAVLALGDHRVRVIEVPRKRTYPPTPENHWFAGPVAPLNAALAECRGFWVARADDDDVWTLDHIASLLRFAQAGGFEFVSARHETHKGPVEPYDLAGIKVGGCQTWLYRDYLKFMHYNPDCWRRRWNRVNDTDLQRRFLSAGVRMGYLDRVVAKVLPRPGETAVGLEAYLKGGAARRMAFGG